MKLLLAILLAVPAPLAAQVRVSVVGPLSAPAGGAAGAAGGASAAGTGGLPGAAAPAPGLAAPVDWNISPQAVRQGYEAAEARFAAAIDAAVAVPAQARTFENTVLALERAGAEYSEAISPAIFLHAVSPDAAVRAAADEALTRESDFGSRLALREDLYRAYREYADKDEPLSGEDKKLLEEALKGFRRSGIALPAEHRAELQALRDRLARLGQEFDRNLQENADEVEATREDLEGVPEAVVSTLQRTPEGKYRVTLDYPTYGPAMRFAKSGELRRQLERKFNDRAAGRNVPLLEEALSLRSRLSRLLGYRNFAEYAIEDRMAKSPGRVREFLERLSRLLAPKAQAEEERLLERKRKDVPGAERVENWERAFYATKLQRETYDLDPEEVRQYFPVERVVEQTLGVYQDLLGLVFRERKGSTWHEDVRLFEIADRASGEVLGTFYLDLHPRPGKFNHAAAYSIISGREVEGGRRRPVSAMVANFSKPSEGRPALLTHGEVETFFHEFGHIMHQTLTRARHATFAGSSVARDFVEAPSQMLENFVWQPQVLERLSGHYQDPSRKLPPELLQKMLAARNFQSAIQTLRQIALASLDLAYHTVEPPVDTTAVLTRVLEALGVPGPTPGTHFQATFGHIMRGYSAAYYGYLWSRVFAQDIFSRFEREGVMSPEVGLAYRKAILERGSTVDEDRMLREFLGREPNEEAFLRSLGLEPRG